jgi:hypothetical protein
MNFFAMSPEDARYSLTYAPTVEGGENLDSLFEYDA